MARPFQSLSEMRRKDCERTLEFMRGQGGPLALADIRYFWRRLGAGGHADNVLRWLEIDGLIVWDRESNIVFLTETESEETQGEEEA